MGEARNYTTEEVQEILRRAAEKSALQSDALEHDALIAAAREAGLDPVAVEAAATEVRMERARKEAARELRAKKRKGFVAHASAFLIVQLSLLLLSMLVGAPFWSAPVAIVWAMGLAVHLLFALREPTDDEIDECARERQARDEARERLRAKLLGKQGAREEETLTNAWEALDSAVDKTVAAALKAAAAQLDQWSQRSKHVPPPRQACTEFAKYVQEKKRSNASLTRTIGDTSASWSMTAVRVDVRNVTHDDSSGEEERVRIGAARGNEKART